MFMKITKWQLRLVRDMTETKFSVKFALSFTNCLMRENIPFQQSHPKNEEPTVEAYKTNLATRCTGWSEKKLEVISQKLKVGFS